MCKLSGMKRKNLFGTIVFCGLLAFSFTGCSDDEDTAPSPDPAPLSGIYVLNSGNLGGNNASLSLYEPAIEQVHADIFKSVNKRGLGDTANDMIVYGSKMYIAVYNSNVIEVTDLQAKSIKQIQSGDEPLLPRFFTAHEGKVYVSLFDGYVACLDTASLTIEKKIKVGRNPEQLVVANGKLYVANSGGLGYDSPIGYDKTVSVIDLNTWTEKSKIKVVINPVNLVKDEQEEVYLVSMGDYGAVLNTFQRIDTKMDTVSVIELTNATEMASVGNKLYMLYSQYDANWNQTVSYIAYDALKEEVLSNRFITDQTEIKKPYKISADKLTNHIYITESGSTNNGDVYAFDAAGKLLYRFEAGVYPVKVVSSAN